MNDQGAIVTTHAEKRAKQRLGLPRKAVKRLATEALESGVPREKFGGSIRRYLDKVYLSKEKEPDIYIKAQNLFIFQNDIFITAWALPRRYQRAATKKQKGLSDV